MGKDGVLFNRKRIKKLERRVRKLEKIIEKDCIHEWDNRTDIENIKCVRCNKKLDYHAIYDMSKYGNNPPLMTEGK